ncbi:hypothetical protein FCV25MIE_15465 [Fagus crenata]
MPIRHVSHLFVPGDTLGRGDSTPRYGARGLAEWEENCYKLATPYDEPCPGPGTSTTFSKRYVGEKLWTIPLQNC